MILITPVFTEKSLGLAKLGKYTFWVDSYANKAVIKAEIAKLFGVHVVTIKTLNMAGEARRNAKGKKYQVLSKKKAIVTLKDKEKIDIFEETKK